MLIQTILEVLVMLLQAIMGGTESGRLAGLFAALFGG